MDAKALLARIIELAPTKDPVSALALGETEWPEMAARTATPEDAETCRLLSISGSEIGDYAVADLWRNRARVLGEAVGWPELIAALDMSQAFRALSVRNDSFCRGKSLDVIEGSSDAVVLIKKLAPVADGPDSGIRVSRQSPSPALIRRFVLEKTGSFQLALKQWDEAAESFTRAIDAAEGPRGLLKSRGGLALANYCRGLQARAQDAISAALTETESVAAEATARDQGDIAVNAQHNAEVMARRGQDLLLYEIL